MADKTVSDIKITKADVKEFVEAAHGNLEKVRQMLAEKPLLLNMPNGNETALGAACQMKHKELILFLLSQGAPMDISAACVLGGGHILCQFNMATLFKECFSASSRSLPTLLHTILSICQRN